MQCLYIYTCILSFYLICILQLLSYALHRNSVIHNGIDSSIESGYSVYVFNTTNLGDYCIFDEYNKFLQLRTLLFVAFGLLELTSVFSIPLLLASIYDEFKRKMSSTDDNGKENRLRYFVWATLILIVLITLLLVCCNAYAIHNGLSSSQTNYKDIFRGFTAMAVAMGVLPVLNIVAAIVVVKFIVNQDEHGINCFGFPDFVNTERKCLCVKIVHGVAIFFVTWFTQFALFNSIYVFIGAIAAPVETGSLLLLYITSLFALISFFAVVLKVFCKTLPTAQPTDPEDPADPEVTQPADPEVTQPADPEVTQPADPEVAQLHNQEAPPVTITYCQGFSGFVCLVPFLLLVCVLASGICVFVTFMYLYITLNQEYRNNRGILTFLGALLPSLLASTSGFFWTRIMPCIGKRNREPLSDTEIRESMESLLRIANRLNPN